MMVPRMGLEPIRGVDTPLGPQPSASANFATSASHCNYINRSFAGATPYEAPAMARNYAPRALRAAITGAASFSSVAATSLNTSAGASLLTRMRSSPLAMIWSPFGTKTRAES
jgi:hypothetical protein